MYVDIEIIAYGLAGWSLFLGVLVMVIHPGGKFMHKLVMVVTSIIAGPVAPFAAVILLPKIISDLWLNTKSKHKF